MARKLRSWFFNTPANTTGDRFRSKNIPSEETYATLLDSTGFLDEASDMATTNRQGFVKVPSDDNNITLRNSNNVAKGSQFVTKPNQPPGTGIKTLTGNYSESTPLNATQPGTPVSGNGIQVTGVVNNISGFKRIGYAVELNIRSVSPVTTSKPPPGSLVPVMCPDGTQGLAEYSGPNTIAPEHFNWIQGISSPVWTVEHKLGFKPNISILIGNEEVEGHIKHIDNNKAVITLSKSLSGNAICS